MVGMTSIEMQDVGCGICDGQGKTTDMAAHTIATSRHDMHLIFICMYVCVC